MLYRKGVDEKGPLEGEGYLDTTLARSGTAFHARSWLWPTESATQTAHDAGGSSSGKDAGLGGGATKVRVGSGALRHRREDERPADFMAIFFRQVGDFKFISRKLFDVD